MSLDDANLTIKRPKCGHEFATTLGQLKINPKSGCAGCGIIITVEGASEPEDLIRKAAREAGLDVE